MIQEAGGWGGNRLVGGGESCKQGSHGEPKRRIRWDDRGKGVGRGYRVSLHYRISVMGSVVSSPSGPAEYD